MVNTVFLYLARPLFYLLSETATYGRIWDDDEVHNLISVEIEFPAIVFDDTFTSQAALSCESKVSPLNDKKIDFRISFDESDDEDYTIWLFHLEIRDISILDLRVWDLMAEGLSGRMLMEHRDAQGQSAMLDLDTARALQFQLGGVRRRMSWREFILGMGLHTAEEIESVGISSAGDFLGTVPIAGRSQAPEKVLEVVRLGEEARGDDILRFTRSSTIHGLGILSDKECSRCCDSCPKVVLRVASCCESGDQAVLAPVQAPQPPAARPSRTMVQRLGRLEEDVHGLRGALGEQREAGVRTSLEKKSTKLVKYLESYVCFSHAGIQTRLQHTFLLLTHLGNVGNNPPTARLSGAKSNKMTLMHYLCKVVLEKLPELLDFSKELGSLEASSKVQRLASIYRLQSEQIGGNPSTIRYVRVTPTEHTNMPSPEDKICLTNLLGISNEEAGLKAGIIFSLLALEHIKFLICFVAFVLLSTRFNLQIFSLQMSCVVSAHSTTFSAHYYMEGVGSKSESGGRTTRERTPEVRHLPVIRDNVKEVMVYG
ncbi:hypothetical protein Tco_0724124 [Tanacetum coccineum]